MVILNKKVFTHIHTHTKTLVLRLSTYIHWVHTHNQLWQRQKDQESKIILGCTASLKPIWATEDPVSRRKKK